jgi:glutamate racemase
MQRTSPIGVFDSGFGGLTVFDEIRTRLPQYDYVYLGDNARTPYGNRSFETVLRFTAECVEALFARGCPLIVIACNTASAKALRTIQQTVLPFSHPTERVLGVIRPTVEALGLHPEDHTVALWATKGTVQSDSFAIEIEKHAPRVRLVQQACPMLVPLVEDGELDGAGLDYFIEKYWRMTRETAAALAPAGGGEIDSLLLGCTHYPLLKPRIRAAIPERVRIVSQNEIVAPSLADYLRRHPEMEARLSRGNTTRFLTTDACEHFDRLAEVFMGHPIASEKVELGGAEG